MRWCFWPPVRAGGVAAPPDHQCQSRSTGRHGTGFRRTAPVHRRGQGGGTRPDFMGDLIRVPLDEHRPVDGAPGARAPDFAPEPKDPFQHHLFQRPPPAFPSGIVHSACHAVAAVFASTALSISGRDWRCARSRRPRSTSTPRWSPSLPVLLAGGCVRVMGKFDCARWARTRTG